MKKSILAFIATTALATFASAETTVQISNVHLCCKGCVTGVEKAVATVKGATVACDKDAGTVALTAADAASAQKAVDALNSAGYFGKSADAAVRFKDTSGAKDGKVATLTVSGVHLCCDKCVKGVNAALAKVKGVSSNTAEKKVTAFEVKGDFSPKEVFAALQAAGFSGKAAN
jgi:copper chaperone CopZ